MEFYRNSNPAVKKGLRRFKNLLLFGLYLSLVAIIVKFANIGSMKEAYAGTVSDVKEIETITRGHDMTLEDKLVLRYLTDYTGSKEIASLMMTYSDKYKIDRNLLLALAFTESSFNPRAVNYNTNGSIDRGLCQLNNKTFTHLKKEEFFDPEVNISHAAEFLRWCLDQSNNNNVKALAFYNAGIGNVSKKKVGEVTLNYIQKIIDEKTRLEDGITAYLDENSDILEAERSTN
jgi:hypothetical protein